MSTGQQLLKAAEVASFLGVSKGRVYQLVASGEIPAVRVGGAIRVPRPAWEEWLRGRSEEALANLRRADCRCAEHGDRSAR